MLNFDTFYKDKFEHIKAYAIKSGISEADSKDLAQNVMIDFWKRLSTGRVDEGKNIDAFLFRRAKWRIVDSARASKDSAERFKTVGEENDLDILEGEKKVEHRENHRALLKKAIKLVNPRKTKWFKLFYEAVFNEKSVKDISAEYNVKPSTVHVEKCRQGKKLIKAAKLILANGF